MKSTSILKRHFRLRKQFIAATGIVLFYALRICGAWGAPDPSFGILGTAFDAIPDHFPRQVAVQPDGRILVAGWRLHSNGGRGIFLRRYSSNGQLDLTFGNQGSAGTVGFITSTTRNFTDSVTVLPDGKIIIYGRAGDVFALWRFTSAGRNDTSFGQNGFLPLSRYPAISSYPAIVTPQSGKLLVGVIKSSTNEVFLLRLNPDGSSDNTFGSFGTASTNVLPNGYGMSVEPVTGAITLSGWIKGAGSVVGLERKFANGQTDLFFQSATNPVQGGPFGLFKSATGGFVIPTFNMGSDEPNTLNYFSQSGSFESMWTLYGNSGHCPALVATQRDGKAIFGNLGRLNRLRASNIYTSMEATDCAVVTYLTYRATPALQSDDKLVFAGVSDNRLALVRVLAN